MQKVVSEFKVCAIIPARGGSKGIPNKNIKNIAGHPLIAWTIMQAKHSQIFDRVIVSTDDEKISEVAKNYGAEVPFLRPSNLSGDKASTESAILHALKWLKNNENYEPDIVNLLQCTSPIRSENSIFEANNLFFGMKADSLLSVTNNDRFQWKRLRNGQVKAMYDYKKRRRRQDINISSNFLQENGSIYIFNVEGFKIHKNRLFGKIIPFIMESHEQFEIDTNLDWLICDKILKDWSVNAKK